MMAPRSAWAVDSIVGAWAQTPSPLVLGTTIRLEFRDQTQASPSEASIRRLGRRQTSPDPAVTTSPRAGTLAPKSAPARERISSKKRMCQAPGSILMTKGLTLQALGTVLGRPEKAMDTSRVPLDQDSMTQTLTWTRTTTRDAQWDLDLARMTMGLI